MSDILMYAAIKEYNRLDNIQRSGASYTLCSWANVDPPSYYYAPTSGGGPNPVGSTPSIVLWQSLINDWTPIRTFTTARTNGFKVCDTSGNFRCQGCCCWVVPAGVTKALFQVWGAGAGTNTICCCGGSTFAPNGGYSAFEITVAAGEGFCLYSGCGFCCFATATTAGGPGQDSFVCLTNSFGTLSVPGSTTPRLVGIGVGSPTPCVCRWHCSLQATGIPYQTGGWVCNFSIPTNTACGMTVCSSLNFCWDSGSDTGEVNWHFDYYCKGCMCCHADIFTSRAPCWARIPAMWPYFCIGSGALNNNTKSISAPVFGFENCTCTELWDGNTCHGCARAASAGFQQIPSVGGYASRVFGGSDASGGDYGGMGMICVSWN